MAEQSLRIGVTVLCVLWSTNFLYNYALDRPADSVGKKHTIDMSALDLGFGPLGFQLLWILAGFGYVLLKLGDPKSGMEKVFDMQVVQLSIGMCLANMAFLYVWVNLENMTVATLIMNGLATFAWGVTARVSFNLKKYESQLGSGVSNMVILLIQNSVGGLAAFATMAAILDIGISLVHDFGFKDPIPTVYVLGTLFDFLSITILFDLGLLDKLALLNLGDVEKCTRYLVTPWITYSFALYTMILYNISKNLEDPTSLSFLNGLYKYSLGILLVKVGVTAWKHFTDVQGSSSKSKSK